MTKNQLEFNKLVETIRSNRENERLKSLESDRNYIINYQNLEETKRRNKATESLDTRKQVETERHNLATEQAQQQSINLQSQQIDINRAAQKETKRSNLAREKETARSNKATEKETKRSNIARETETNRSNLAREAETARSNRVNEALQASRNAEQARSNRANEGLIAQRNAEEVRHNKNAEVLQLQSNQIRQDEVNKTNQYRYDELNVKQQSNLNDYTLRQNQLQETKRHNKAQEVNAAKTTSNNAIIGGFNAAENAVDDVFRSAVQIIKLKGQ